MPDLPNGTVTLLFTDIEGSTRLLQRLGGSRYGSVLREHHRIMRNAISACSGVEVKTEGDSFFAVFPRAGDAITAVVQAQRALAAHAWPDGDAVKVRMGIHTGQVETVDGEYIGLDVHRAARISAAAHGGQVLLSDAVGALARSHLPPDVTLVDLGEHSLKDLDRTEHLLQLVIAGLRSEFPPVRTPSTRLHKLPPETSSFIGRERELARAGELLAGTRLLTLTGPGGTGKTRLAVQLARTTAPAFGDGVAFVPLAPISDPELVAPTVRQAVAVAEVVGQSAIDTLVERLHDRDVLLVLDNFEQLLPAVPVVAQLLARTDRLKLIVTSRAALHLSSEQELAVPPLDVPAVDEADDLDALSQSDAVALFMQRARTIRPDFALSTANARAIVEICARLDGLPLAIELAASRVKLLPPQALLDRLEHRLDLLQSSTADRTDRQRTLRGAIDWSYELLGTKERGLFRRLAIFVGGWRLEDAERVIVAAGRLDLDILEGHGQLVDHSLLRQVETANGEARFSMLETIREFGLEKLAETGELSATAEAHAQHFAELAQQAEPHLTGGPEWLDRLEIEQANIRAALDWLGRHEIVDGLDAAGRLWRFWHLRGHLREGSRLTAGLLARPVPEGPDGAIARARALIGHAGLTYWQLDYETARRSYEEAIEIAHEVGDRRLELDGLYSLGYVRAIEADWDGALTAYAEAEAIYREMGDPLGEAWAMMGRGMVTTLRGDHEAAVPILEATEARFEALNDGFGARNTISVKERALMQLGRLDETRRINLDFIRRSHADQDPTALSAALLDAASLAALDGRHERAARLIGAAERIVEVSGGQPPPELVNRIEPRPILRQAMDEDVLERLLAEGRRLTAEDAVAEALAGEA